MKNINFLFFLIILIPFSSISQELNYPIDVVYNEELEIYYVSNWGEGNGTVLTVNKNGEVTGTLFSAIKFGGGLCLIGNVLYVADNKDLYGGTLPSYLVGIDITTGAELSRVEIASDGAYLDLMDSDLNGHIYICNSEKSVIHKYNIETQETVTFMDDIQDPYGICYDYIDDRLIYTASKSSGSRLISINLDGSNKKEEFYYDGWIEGVIMNDVGEYFISSWTGVGSAPWGTEPVYKLDHALNWKFRLLDDQNRPFGMCLGHEEYLAICNWGSNELNFFDLTPFGTNESMVHNDGLNIYPNPGSGSIKISLPSAASNNGVLNVTDLNGRIIFTRDLQFDENSAELQIDLTHLVPGIYMVLLQTENRLYREKLVMQ